MPNSLKKAIAVIAAILVWQAASMLIGYEILLASPVSVFKTLAGMVSSPDFWMTVLRSSLRIAAGFFAAYIAALILGILANRFEWVKTLLWPWTLTIKSIPVASFIVLALIWLSAKRVVGFVCFMATFPLIYNNILEGLANVDRAQIEAAQMLGANWFRTVRTVSIPNISPYLLSAASTGCGTAFKAGVAAEVLAVITGSIGEHIYMSKVYFETSSLFAWTLVIILLCFVFEKLFCAVIKGFVLLSKK